MSTPTPISHISTAQFQELKDLLEEDFNDLIHNYMTDSEVRLQDMQRAFEDEDNRLGFEAAHSLKGASSNLGATHLTELCYQLQEACRNNRILDNEQLIHDIHTECRAVNAQIKTLLEA